jgi:hypothetical protein
MRKDNLKDQRVRTFVAANNIELAYVAFYAIWLNRIKARSPRCAISRSTGPTTKPTKFKLAWSAASSPGATATPEM